MFLDFSTAIARYGREKCCELGINEPKNEEIIQLGEKVMEAKYGNLFQMYEKITNQNPYQTPMKIYPAVHYTMGGIWVDYNLMSTIPGCFVVGEANFSDHGANRLGASALMQGLADGYFILPYTISDYLAEDIRKNSFPIKYPEFTMAEKNVRDRLNFFVKNQGNHPVNYFHKILGNIMWNNVGMARDEKGLLDAIEKIQRIRKEFWSDVRVPGAIDELNPELEKAGRVADFLELGELIAKDALNRKESCGGHFRREFQSEEGEALRDDECYAYVSAWEYQEENIEEERLHKEHLNFDFVELKTRSYK